MTRTEPQISDSAGSRSTAADRYGEGRTLKQPRVQPTEGGGSLRRLLPVTRDALAIFREAGDRYGEGRTLRNVGLIFQDLHRFEEAVAYYQDARDLPGGR